MDNFYDNPKAVRKFALEQQYKFCTDLPEDSHVFPGSRTEDLRLLNPALYEKVCTKLISVFHNAGYDYMRWNITTSFQSVTQEYQKGIIHTDYNTALAAVLYLTPNAPLNSGTTLYKSNSKFNQKQYITALKENAARFKQGQEVSFEYHKMFDEFVTVNNVYNSLIIYEGQMFHSANNFFGDVLDNSRLTQVFFIHRIDAQRQNSFPLNRAKEVKI